MATVNAMDVMSSKMRKRDSSLGYIYDVVNDYVTTPMTGIYNNTAAALTQAGVSGKSWYISYATWRVSGGATGTSDVSIKLLDGTTTIYNTIISKQISAGAFSEITFKNPIKITAGNAVSLTADASGNAGTNITLNLGLFNK